jgi:Domain of unknown function (DUF4124)
MNRLIPVIERRLKWLVVTCLLFGAHLSDLGVTASHAQLYKWVDENGKVQYSDTVPPGATDRARKELRADGTVKTSTERAATAEEKRLAALKAIEDAKLKQIQDERDRKDKALLNTYSDLADFDRVRDRALGTMEGEIRGLQEREVTLNKVIASEGKFVPPAPAAAPVAASPVAGKAATPPPPVKPPPAKSASTLLLEAKSELPRAKEAIVSKRRLLEDLTALYAADRVRLSKLIDAEKAKISTANVANVAEAKSTPAQAAALPAKKK